MDRSTRSVALAVVVDVVVVLLFVVIGRRNHDEADALRATAETAAPFLVGLAAAWFAARAWRRPMRLATGLVVWPITVLAGMVVRRAVFGDGTAPAFVIVATLFLGAGFVGWRVVAGLSAHSGATTTAGTSKHQAS
jgi:peptidoglycan/LPS O-acetylase OafA/YrhL